MHREFSGGVLESRAGIDMHVLWGRGTRGMRRLMDGTPYLEELDMEGADLRMMRGAPVLDAHNRGSVRSILGHVTSYEVRDGAGYADLHIVDPVVRQLYEAGSLRDVSVGYTIEAVERAGFDGDVPIIRVRAWTPFEISLVPVGFDSTAQILRAP